MTDDHLTLRASHDERSAVADALASALAEGKLTVVEYEERVGHAYAAKTRGELVPLTSDLSAHPPTVTPGRGLSQESSSSVERVTAIFGNDSRKGPWHVPGRLLVQSVFGDCHIEMQHAEFTSQITVIEATARFGSITVFVPDDAQVRLTGRALFGSKEIKRRPGGEPGGPIIEVQCDVLFGSVTVRAPKRRIWG
ncbi:MAG: DUF1707 SHOCT-like domain-containing protein [Jatrophihabitans sp.]